MKYLIVIFIFCCMSGVAQPLRDINYNYQYNPEEKFLFTLLPVKLSDSWYILYELNLRDTTQNINLYKIEWQIRENLSNKDGRLLDTSSDSSFITSKSKLSGNIKIPFTSIPQVIVAKIIHQQANRAWIYYEVLENNYPVNDLLTVGNVTHLGKFLKAPQQGSLRSASSSIVSFYNDQFPPAAPAFSEGQAKVSKGMKVDSIFTVSPGTALSFNQRGLYLIQSDTISNNGMAVRAEDDYPRYSKVQNLPGPLIYICSKQEYDRLEAAKGDKKIFDRTVLSITGDSERAKKLIRNYFRRVELANQYFTSYKEGWKTDRGMIYIIFGLPDEVFKFQDREVWKYDNASFDITFNFTKASSVFDPDNYVLIRNQKYRQTWYEVVDLWRNARF
jgi:GWxTD domain-containing protein